jgi:(R,R)-butanediol dehydrogenase/meso-butanediol dehydrogenase/diacetyl reductase
MKAARLRGTREVVLEEIPVPGISGDEALVKVEYCGICGTDVASFRSLEFFPVGCFIGHEISGVIAKVGKGVTRWKPGDRVAINTLCPCGKCYACRHGLLSNCESLLDEAIGTKTSESLPGGFSEFVRVTEAEMKLHSLEGVSFEEGALAVPLGETLHAVRVSSFKPRDYVMVMGCGPMGLAAITFLKNGGAGLIIATEINAKRAETAKKLGADYVFNPIEVPNLREEVLGLTNGLGVNQVFECSGSHQAFQSAPDFIRPGGQFVVIGVIGSPVEIIPLKFQVGGLQLQASWCQTDEFAMVIEFLKKHVAPVQEIITSKIKLSDIVERGFNELLKPNNAQIKILVSPE